MLEEVSRAWLSELKERVKVSPSRSPISKALLVVVSSSIEKFSIAVIVGASLMAVIVT